MNTEDRLDTQIRERLGADAPSAAPGHLFESAMARIEATPQRGGGWPGHPVTTLLAAAAVLLLAVLAGTQLAGLIERPVGDQPSPSASAMPSESSEPSPAPSTSASTAASPSATPTPGAHDALVLRVVNLGGGPMYPTHLLPWVELLADGTFIWQPVPSATSTGHLVRRTLTPQGLSEIREHIFGGGRLDESATHDLESLPGAEPPGRGVSSYIFTAGGGEDLVVVTSVQWLGDEEESAYYQPAPEREELDAIAQQLRDPEALLGADAWAGPAEPYEGEEYLLSLTLHADTPLYGTTDASEIPWPFDGPLDQFGVEAGDARPPIIRCGVVGRAAAAQVIDALAALDFSEVGPDRATNGSLDWAAGNGTVDVALLPVTPGGYPGCESQP